MFRKCRELGVVNFLKFSIISKDFATLRVSVVNTLQSVESHLQFEPEQCARKTRARRLGLLLLWGRHRIRPRVVGCFQRMLGKGLSQYICRCEPERGVPDLNPNPMPTPF